MRTEQEPCPECRLKGGDDGCCAEEDLELQRSSHGPPTLQIEAGTFGPGGPSGFMRQLRSSVTSMATSELATVGRSAADCPYLQRWLGYYETVDAAHLQRSIQLYAHPTGTSPQDFEEAVVDRVRRGIRRWASTGEIDRVPDDVPRSGAGPGSAAPLGRAGVPLPRALRDRLEGSFGEPLSAVRVHADGPASSDAAARSALAYTVGDDIAVAPGLYRPGTPAGDALIAHEVAHTVQQSHRAHRPGSMDVRTEHALEREADEAAAHAVTGRRASIRGRVGSGLALQSCADCTRYGASGLRLEVEGFRRCGLLDPPFRPSNVSPFPVYEWGDDLAHRRLDPSCQPMGLPGPPEMASLGRGGGAVGLGAMAQGQYPMPVPIEPPVMPPFEPIMPPIEPPVLPPIEPPFIPPVEPVPIPVEPVPGPPIQPTPPVGPWPTPPIPPVVPVPHPQPTPDIREDDKRYLDRLTPDQMEYYRFLRGAQRQEPVEGEDLQPAPVTPRPVPNPDNQAEPGEEPGEDKKRNKKKCVGFDTRRRGGHVAHDAYATTKSLSNFDWFARSPGGTQINYDGRSPTTALVWEVKVGHGWFFNCAKKDVAALTLARWDAQKDRGMTVAAACGYVHIWGCQDRWVAGLLNQRWGGTPSVTT